MLCFAIQNHYLTNLAVILFGICNISFDQVFVLLSLLGGLAISNACIWAIVRDGEVWNKWFDCPWLALNPILGLRKSDGFSFDLPWLSLHVLSCACFAWLLSSRKFCSYANSYLRELITKLLGSKQCFLEAAYLLVISKFFLSWIHEILLCTSFYP